MKAPFFVLGTQRSGTTLLCQMLNAQGEVLVVNEIFPLYDYLDKPADRLQPLAALMEDRFGPPGLRRSPARSAFEILESSMQFRLEATNKQRWGLKDPRLTYYLKPFLERYPDAQFVIIIRDARAVVASYLRQHWNVANTLCGAELWTREIQIQLDFAREHPDRCLVVLYRDLLEQPERSLGEICRFVDLPFSRSMLEFHRNQPQILIHEGNAATLRPVDKSRRDGWRNELSARQIDTVETIAGPRLVELGFELLGQPRRIGFLERAFMRIHQWILTNWWWQKRTGFGGIRRRLVCALPESIKSPPAAQVERTV